MYAMRRLVALLHHVCGSQWPVRAGALLLPAETVARVRSDGALHRAQHTTAAAFAAEGLSHTSRCMARTAIHRSGLRACDNMLHIT